MSGEEFEVNETEIIEAMMEYEGFTAEEAALTYQQRKKLPASAFCGPNRTYPAHDARRVRAGLQRLSQFGHRLKPSTRISIARCLIRRAKKMGIEVSDEVKRKLTKGKPVSETVEDRIVRWFLENYGKTCKEC